MAFQLKVVQLLLRVCLGFFSGVGVGGISVGAITKSLDHKPTSEAMDMVLQLVIIFEEIWRVYISGESKTKYNQRSKITKIQ